MLSLKRPFLLPRKSQFCRTKTCVAHPQPADPVSTMGLSEIFTLCIWYMASSLAWLGPASPQELQELIQHTPTQHYKCSSTPSTLQRSPEASAVYKETRRSPLYYENGARIIVLTLPVLRSWLFDDKKGEYVERVLQQQFALHYADNRQCWRSCNIACNTRDLNSGKQLRY